MFIYIKMGIFYIFAIGYFAITFYAITNPVVADQKTFATTVTYASLEEALAFDILYLLREYAMAVDG